MNTFENRNALPMGYYLGDYQIQSILGEGGFGITYLAKHLSLNASVAIKEYFPAELAVREGQSYTVQAKSQKDTDNFAWGLDRFIQEAQTLAQFKHPNIVRVLHFFQALHTAYIVMEYEDGQNLASLLQNGETADEEEIMAFLPALLTGLETVHQAGYLHRDIKPANIYLRTKDRSPLLIDFGAARYDLGSRSRSITTIVTPGYAPFEQYQTSGNQQGPWTDIYALGAVLYRLMSGKTPAEAPERVSAMIGNQPDPLKPVVEIGGGRYSTALLEGIDWALAIRERERPQNVKEWRERLFGESPQHIEPILRTDPPVTVSAPAPTATGQPKILTGVGIVLILLILGFWGYYRIPSENIDGNQEVTVAPNPIFETPGPQNPSYRSPPERFPGVTERPPQNPLPLPEGPPRVPERSPVAPTPPSPEMPPIYDRGRPPPVQVPVSPPVMPDNIQPSKQQADSIGQKIWMNESSGKISGLTSWNKGENWASLGIGHFIWYPQGQEDSFIETFPDLIKFIQQQGVTVPHWLQNSPPCPWRTRQEFLNDTNTPKMAELKTLMKDTIPQQVRFLISRLELALQKILETLPTQSQRDHVREQFYRVAKTPKGIYALVDYVNFKGEGTSPKERYQDQGWGLLQVLEQMPGHSANATDEFADMVEFILQRRIQNSPPERKESRWLPGWQKRINTYR